MSHYQMPTVSFKMDFRADVKGHEWLLTRTHMRWLSNGRFDENIEILDDNGGIVATCLQSMAIYPAGRGSKKEASTNAKL